MLVHSIRHLQCLCCHHHYHSPLSRVANLMVSVACVARCRVFSSETAPCTSTALAPTPAQVHILCQWVPPRSSTRRIVRVLPAPFHPRSRRRHKRPLCQYQMCHSLTRFCPALSLSTCPDQRGCNWESYSIKFSTMWWLTQRQSPTGINSCTWAVAIGLRLGTPICAAHPFNCGAWVDNMGTHGLSCRLGISRLARHQQINDLVSGEPLSAHPSRPAESRKASCGTVKCAQTALL